MYNSNQSCGEQSNNVNSIESYSIESYSIENKIQNTIQTKELDLSNETAISFLYFVIHESITYTYLIRYNELLFVKLNDKKLTEIEKIIHTLHDEFVAVIKRLLDSSVIPFLGTKIHYDTIIHSIDTDLYTEYFNEEVKNIIDHYKNEEKNIICVDSQSLHLYQEKILNYYKSVSWKFIDTAGKYFELTDNSVDHKLKEKNCCAGKIKVEMEKFNRLLVNRYK